MPAGFCFEAVSERGMAEKRRAASLCEQGLPSAAAGLRGQTGRLRFKRPAQAEKRRRAPGSLYQQLQNNCGDWIGNLFKIYEI